MTDPMRPGSTWKREPRNCARSPIGHLRSSQVVATDAGHRLNEETPELIAFAVRTVGRAVQTGTQVTLDAVEVEALGGRLWAAEGERPGR